MITYGETRIYQTRNLQPNDTIHYHDCIPMLQERLNHIRPVLTKKDFYRRYYQGEFGNTSYMWSNFLEWESSGYSKLVAIRTLRPKGRCDYFIPNWDVAFRWNDFIDNGYHPEELNISAQIPEEDKLCQGEVSIVDGKLHAWLSEDLRPMRSALRENSFHLKGFKAHWYLKAKLCHNSWEWLWYLLENYPGHTVEFSTLRYSWGTIPGHNTIIWEVRKY